jgi:hypothetical protein
LWFHHRRAPRPERSPGGLSGRTREPLAVDDATSPRIRRAHPARGNDHPRQRIGHQRRAQPDRGRMVRKLGPPSCPLPKVKRVWRWNPPQPSAPWWWCRVYHQGKYTPDSVIFRRYGPTARTRDGTASACSDYRRSLCASPARPGAGGSKRGSKISACRNGARRGQPAASSRLCHLSRSAFSARISSSCWAHRFQGSCIQDAQVVVSLTQRS